MRIQRIFGAFLTVSLFLGMLFFPLCPALAEGTSIIAESAYPGQVVRIPSPAGTPALRRLVLMKKSGEAVEESPFFSFRGESFALLPLGPDMEPGDYLLKGELADGEISYVRGFTVLPRKFRRETIDLNSALTSLRTEEDDLKREEALKIQAIYATIDGEILYDEVSFISPIDFEELDYFRVSSEYGDRRIFRYIDNSVALALHTGIDMAAKSGVPVLAAGRGRVVMAEERIISGYSVVIGHLPGVYTVYFHLKELDVKPGQIVEKGQRIGSVGVSGLATGPHLHWEVRVNGVAVDPRELTQSEIIDKITTAGNGG
jgi:murein DD-endopeptidase MepM/ murein hydrolase activator NlpD